MKRKKKIYEKTSCLIFTSISQLSVYIGILFVLFPIKADQFSSFIFLIASFLLLGIGIIINMMPIKVTKMVYFILRSKIKYSDSYAKSKENRRLLYQVSWMFVCLAFMFLLGLV